MGALFIISGVLTLIIILFIVREIESRDGINVQPSLKAILMVWKEEASIKKLFAILELYCLYLIVTGIVFILIGFDPDNIMEFIFGLVVFSAPALIYQIVRYKSKR